MSVNIEELKAKVQKAQEENTVKIAEAAEIAQLQATLNLENSESLFKSKVALQASGRQTAKLQTLINDCMGIISTVPIHNVKTRTARAWTESHRYSFGTQVDLMYQLASGILFACAEHKALLIEHTGLGLEIVEEMVTAFGSPKYYSRNFHTIVQEKPFHIERINTVMEVMQSELGVVINTEALTAINLKLDFVNGETQAEQEFSKAVEAINEADFDM